MRGHDSVALGLSYGVPTDSALRDQFGLEAYYRVYVSQAISLIPGLQMIWNPSRNAEDDQITVFSMRVRLSF